MALLVSGRSAAWLAHLHGVQGVVGSNPAAPTIPLKADGRYLKDKNQRFLFLPTGFESRKHLDTRLRVDAEDGVQTCAE